MIKAFESISNVCPIPTDEYKALYQLYCAARLVVLSKTLDEIAGELLGEYVEAMDKLLEARGGPERDNIPDLGKIIEAAEKAAEKGILFQYPFTFMQDGQWYQANSESDVRPIEFVEVEGEP
jgi:hypothetical protein